MIEAPAEFKGAAISLVRLTKRYGDVVATDDIDLEIRAGEFVTLLGPSGSGKTTTLMMIAGFVVPTQGNILIDGRSIIGMPPSKRNLGMVFQSYSLFPHMNVYSNIAFPLEMRRINRQDIRARVRSALKWCAFLNSKTAALTIKRRTAATYRFCESSGLRTSGASFGRTIRRVRLETQAGDADRAPPAA